jgi:hypothetical protein
MNRGGKEKPDSPFAAVCGSLMGLVSPVPLFFFCIGTGNFCSYPSLLYDQAFFNQKLQCFSYRSTIYIVLLADLTFRWE